MKYFMAFIIIDLDRPRRGLIKVDQASLIQLKSVIDENQPAGAQLPVPEDCISPRR
jgi:hypothetical protein